MKKFQERSKRGQQRLIICFAFVVAVLLIVAVFVFDKSGFEDIGSLVNPSIEPTVTYAPEPNKPTVTPTITAAVTPDIQPTQIPSGTEDDGPVSAQDIVDRILRYTLEPEYGYGSSVAPGLTIEESYMMQLAGIKEKGTEISLADVGAGDIGFYGNSVCVCVGIDENQNAVFAYANGYVSEYLSNGGIYLGYTKEQNDALFYGMYPVPCDTYYDSTEGFSDFTKVAQKAQKYYPTRTAFTEELFSIGRLFSREDVELVKELVPEDLMREHNVKYEEGSMESFLDNFTEYADAEAFSDGDFCFVLKQTFRLSTGNYLYAEILNLSAEEFLSKAGTWGFTISDTGLIPYMDYKLSKYIGRGFVKAKDTVYHYDSEGNLTGYEYVDKENTEGTIVEGEDGSRTYMGDGFSFTLPEDGVIVQEFDTIISLGDMKYLLIDKNGIAYDEDMSSFRGLDESIIMQLLEQKLERINGEAE